MVEIEFFLSDEPQYGLGQRDEIGGTPRVRRFPAVNAARVAATTMFAIAAVLAAVAPFQRVYTVRESDGAHRSSYWVDGWGRFRVSDGGPVPPGLHETRWGVATSACAAGLALLALASAAAALPVLAARIPPRIATGITGVAGALAGTLAGLLIAAWLEISARTDTLKASVDFGGGLGSRIRYDVPLGPFLWFGAAALLAAVLAIVATPLLRRS